MIDLTLNELRLVNHVVSCFTNILAFHDNQRKRERWEILCELLDSAVRGAEERLSTEEPVSIGVEDYDVICEAFERSLASDRKEAARFDPIIDTVRERIKQKKRKPETVDDVCHMVYAKHKNPCRTANRNVVLGFLDELNHMPELRKELNLSMSVEPTERIGYQQNLLEEMNLKDGLYKRFYEALSNYGNVKVLSLTPNHHG